MYRFSNQISKEENDAFVTKHPLCNLLQSSSWADIKQNWDSIYTGVYENEVLVGTALVLVKRLPLGFTMFYIPRGPVMDFENIDLLKFYFTELKKLAKTYRCLFIKMDPGIICNSIHINNETSEEKNIVSILNNMKNAGAIHTGFSKDMHDTIQPRFNAVVYPNFFDDEQLPKRCKKMLKIAEKKKVNIQIYGKERLDDFANVMKATTQRKQISLRDKEYFEKLLDTYKDDAFLVLASLNLKQMCEELEERYEKNKKDLENCKENQVKKLFTLQELDASLTRDLNEIREFMEKDGDEVIIAGTLSIVYGSTSEILYAGMDSRYKRYMAPYITWKKTIETCFEKGCTWSNMGGVDGSLKDGLTTFKSNFNPVINEFIGEFDIPVNRLFYSLAIFAMNTRKKIMNRHA